MITHDKTQRRIKRVRSKLAANKFIPRLSIFRSNKHILAQVIDDNRGKTLAFVSSELIKKKSSKMEKSIEVGKLIAEATRKMKIKKVKFDRGRYRYHGRVKALAESARQYGLKF